MNPLAASAGGLPGAAGPDAAFAAWCLAGAAIVLALLLALAVRALLRQRVLLARHREITDTEGRRRVEQSRAVLKGQVAEHFAPLLPGFGYHPKDARFLGQPVDYVVFNGLNELGGVTSGTSSRPREIEIVLVEIKTGGGRLGPGEKAIRDAVAAGRVRFETLRLDGAGRLVPED
jgi:hypothetical protein